jgi:hypothetical protein
MFPPWVTVSLPRGWNQEIKHILLVHLMHGLFCTWTQKLYYIYRSYITIFTRHILPHPTQPLASQHPVFMYLLGEPASLLVMTNTHPPLSLVCQQLPHPLLALPPFHTPQFRLHCLHRQHQQLQSSSSGTVTTYVVLAGSWRTLLSSLIHYLKLENSCQITWSFGLHIP